MRGSILTSTRTCKDCRAFGWTGCFSLSGGLGDDSRVSQERASIAGNSCVSGDLLNGGMEMLKASNQQNRSITLPLARPTRSLRGECNIRCFQRLSRAVSWILLSPREHTEVRTLWDSTSADLRDVESGMSKIVLVLRVLAFLSGRLGSKPPPALLVHRLATTQHRPASPW